MSYFAVLDTNVLVSGMLTNFGDTATAQVFDRLIAGEIFPLYSYEILEEYDDVLHRVKFNFNFDMVNDLIDMVKTYGVRIMPQSTGERLPDLKDLPFYEVAKTCQDINARLVTGNTKHFPQEKFIVTPSEFIALMDQRS